jgi:hypothetical protein
MPSKTEKQKKFFGAVMGAEKGQKGVSGEAKKVAKEMPKKEIKKFLKTEDEDEQSVVKKMKKGGGKAEFKGPNVKERKHFAPPTKTHKAKKGKGSYDRKKQASEDEEDPCWKGYKQYGMKKKKGKEVPNCVKESTSIYKFIESIMTNNHAEAHNHLKDAINQKIMKRIEAEIDTSLF